MSFLPISSGLSSKITVQHFSIGGFTLDAIVEESFEVSATLTGSAVESGARVSDHKIKNPRAGLIRGVIVNYDTNDSFGKLFPQIDEQLKKLDLPVQVSAATDYVRATVNRFVAPLTKSASRIIPSFLNDYSSTDDRITKIKSTLEDLCFSDDLLTVSTSSGEYTQISLSAVSIVRVGESAEVSLSFIEVPTYDVAIIEGINAVIKPQQQQTKAEATNKPQSENKSDKAKQQSSKPQNKGKTQPQESKKSVLKSIFENI